MNTNTNTLVHCKCSNQHACSKQCGFLPYKYNYRQHNFFCHKDKLLPDKKVLWQFHYTRQGRLTIQKTLQLPIRLLPPVQRGKTPEVTTKIPPAGSFCQFLNFVGIKVFPGSQVLTFNIFFLIYKLRHLPPNCTKEASSLRIISKANLI